MTVMRDVQYVMSAALPCVNYVSHIVQICSRRNFKSDPITMHKVALTSSAVRLLDVVNDMMSSTLPSKHGSQSWAMLFLRVDRKETWKSMLIWYRCREPAVFSTVLSTDWLRDLELEKSGLKILKCNYSWNMSKMFQLARLKELCTMILTRK